MNILLPMIIIAVLCIVGFMFPKSRLVFLFQILFAWILLAFNNGGVDYLVHTGMYNNAFFNTSIVDSPLYYNFCYLAKNLSMSFFTMNMLLNTICIAIIVYIIKNSTKNVSIVGSFFLIYPIIENIIQKRFFIGSTFIILGLFILMKKNIKKYNLLSFLMITIGGLIHQALFIFYLVFFLQKLNYKIIKKYIFIVVLCSFVMIPFLPKILLMLFPSTKVALYFIYLKIGIFDSICWMLLHLAFVIMLFLFDKYCKSDDEDDFLLEIKKLNLISLIFLSLYYYEPTFIRFFRCLLIFNYIFVSIKMLKKSNQKYYTKNQFGLFTGWTCLIIISYLLIYVFTGASFKYLVEPEFVNNLIFQFLFGVI